MHQTNFARKAAAMPVIYALSYYDYFDDYYY